MKLYSKNIIAILLCACANTSFAEVEIRIKSDYEAGVVQYQRGNTKMAVLFFEQGTDKGDPKSMFALGTHYYFGDGVEQNYAKAKTLFESCSEKGMVEANTMLGLMYQKGEGVPADSARAKDYLSKAAHSCDAHAQNLLAQSLYAGYAGVANRTEALAWLYLAAPYSKDASAGVVHIEKESATADIVAAKARKSELEAKLACPK